MGVVSLTWKLESSWWYTSFRVKILNFGAMEWAPRMFFRLLEFLWPCKANNFHCECNRVCAPRPKMGGGGRGRMVRPIADAYGHVTHITRKPFFFWFRIYMGHYCQYFLLSEKIGHIRSPMIKCRKRRPGIYLWVAVSCINSIFIQPSTNSA